MIRARAFAGKRYAVYGLARSGLATVKALLASGAEVLAWDDDLAKVRSLRDTAGKNENLFIDDFTDWCELKAEALVLSPGVPLNTHPLVQLARDARLEIIGDIELFARARPELPPHKVVGITGTNGKSTTTALVHHILKTAGVPTTMGGNIGLPILSQDPLAEGGVYVLELSSYQIDLTQSLDCDVAVLLNITPDHLDRYESFEAYAASKARLFEMQSIGGFAVLGIDDPQALRLHESLRDSRAKKGDTVFGAFGSYLTDADYGPWLGGRFRQTDWPTLQGPHNAQNAAAAIAACSSLGVSYNTTEDALTTYPGLPHRMERIRERNSVLFVNDSKGTNTEAVAPALAAYERIRWILGGYAKTESLGDTERHLDHVVSAYTIGQAGPMLARLLRDKGVTVTECETLENAVNHAAKDSQAGDVVLLSPACASQDQYRDFEHRGNRFRELVGAL